MQLDEIFPDNIGHMTKYSASYWNSRLAVRVSARQDLADRKPSTLDNSSLGGEQWTWFRLAKIRRILGFQQNRSVYLSSPLGYNGLLNPGIVFAVVCV